MDNDSRQRVWKYLLSRSDELAVDLLPVDRIAAPIEEAHWYVAIAALQNEVLARAHERAAGPTSFALVKSIADNNLMARQRIRNEHAMCQTVVQSIRAANASAEFASMVGASTSARSASTDAPSGAATGAATARSAPTSLSGLNSGGASSVSGGSSGAGSSLGQARYGNTFRGAATNSGSLLASSTWPRLKPVPATAAKVILAPIFPTSAPEPDAVSNNADIQFVAALRLIALHRPLDVPRVVKRFLFSTLRVPQARAWRGPSLSVCLPRTYIRAMMVNPAELAAQAQGGGGTTTGPALQWGSDTQASGDNTPTSYRSHQLCGGDSGPNAFSGADEDGGSSCDFGDEGSGEGGDGGGSGGGSPVSLSALVGGGGPSGGAGGEGDGSVADAAAGAAAPAGEGRDAALSILSDSLWSADDEGSAQLEQEGATGDSTPQLAAVSAACGAAATEAAAETAVPVLHLAESCPEAQQQQQQVSDDSSTVTPRPKSLVSAKSAKELRAAWMAAASGPSTPVASATAPATDRSGGASGRRGSSSGIAEAGSLPPTAPPSASALSPGVFSTGASAFSPGSGAAPGSAWSPGQAGTPPPAPGGWAAKTAAAAVTSPEPGPGFYADAAQATPPTKAAGSAASPAAASPAAEASAAASSSAWEPQVLDLVRTMTEVAGNHSSGAKLSVLAGIFKALYTPPLTVPLASGSTLALASSPGASDVVASDRADEGGAGPRESPTLRGGAAPAAGGSGAELSLPGPAPVRAVRYGRSTGTATPLMSSRTVSDETSPSRPLPASLAGTAATDGAAPRLSPAAPGASAATPASSFLIGMSGSRAAPGLPALSLEPAVLDQASATGEEEGAASPPTPTAPAQPGPALVHGVPVVLDEAKASEARAVLQAALEDIRTFCVGFARGVLYRYPVLGALPARLPRTSGGSAEEGMQDHGMSGPQMNLLQQGVTRVSGGSSSANSGSSSSGGGGILAGVKRVTGVGRQSQTIDETAIIGASREAVLSWGRVNPSTNANAAARSSGRRGSASSTGSAGGSGAGMPTASDTIDCTKLVLRIVQEAFYSFIFPTLYPLMRQAYVTADAEWADALLVLQAASPCVFGLRPIYCEYGTPASCAQHAALPADTEAIDASVGLFKCVGPSPAARAAVLHAQAITTLRLLPRQRTPLGKANALRACMQAVTAGSAMECELEDAEKRHRASQSVAPGTGVTAGPVGADDMMPRLCFIVAQAGIATMFTELAYLEHCLPQDRTLGEDGYAIVSLRGALMHCLDVAGELRQAASAGKGRI